MQPTRRVFEKFFNHFFQILFVLVALFIVIGPLLKRLSKLFFFLCFFMPSIVLSFEFPPERSENDAKNGDYGKIGHREESGIQV